MMIVLTKKMLAFVCIIYGNFKLKNCFIASGSLNSLNLTNIAYQSIMKNTVGNSNAHEVG